MRMSEISNHCLCDQCDGYDCGSCDEEGNTIERKIRFSITNFSDEELEEELKRRGIK